MREGETCPHCGAESVVRVGPARPSVTPPLLTDEGLPPGRHVVDPDRRCLVCGFGWPVDDPFPRWPLSTDPGWLHPVDHRQASGLLRERFRMTVRVCDALRDAPEADCGEPLYAYGDLRDWLRDRYGDELGDPVGPGMDRLVVPAADGDLVRLLESANHVCRALDLVRSASVSEYDRDVAELRRRLADFDGRRRELVEEIDRDGGARPEWADLLHRDEPDEDLDDDPDDEMDGDPDDDEATLEALLRRGDDDGDDSDVDGDDEHAGVDESWEAVVDVAEAVFGPHGSALGWARDAWRMLDAAGLTSFEGHVERARVTCRLLCLDVLRQEFDVRMFDGGAPGYWRSDVDALLDATGGIDPVVLGMLAERDGLGLDTDADAEYEDGVGPRRRRRDDRAGALRGRVGTAVDAAGRGRVRLALGLVPGRRAVPALSRGGGVDRQLGPVGGQDGRLPMDRRRDADRLSRCGRRRRRI